MNANAIIVTTTSASREEADSIANKLVELRLAACVQLSEISSVYRWKNDVTTSSEVMLTVKSRESLYQEIENIIEALSSYDTPEIVATPITHGSKSYLTWIFEETRDR